MTHSGKRLKIVSIEERIFVILEINHLRCSFELTNSTTARITNIVSLRMFRVKVGKLPRIKRPLQYQRLIERNIYGIIVTCWSLVIQSVIISVYRIFVNIISVPETTQKFFQIKLWYIFKFYKKFYLILTFYVLLTVINYVDLFEDK